jgi:hypothetical protein
MSNANKLGRGLIGAFLPLSVFVVVVSIPLAPAVAGPAPVRPAPVGSADPSIAWTPTLAPVPSTLPSQQPANSSGTGSVSCSTSSTCVAVGSVGDDYDNNYPLVERLSDGRWTATTTPVPRGPARQGVRGELVSVSCPTVKTCAAVGIYNSKGGQTGLLEIYSGGKWTATRAMPPRALNLGRTSLSWLS